MRMQQLGKYRVIIRSWSKALMRSLIMGMIFMTLALSSRAQDPGTTGLENGATGPDGSGVEGVPINGG